MGLVRKYAKRGPEEWGPLFHTILQSRIRDWARRRKVRNRFRVWLGKSAAADNHDEPDPLLQFADPRPDNPDQKLDDHNAMETLIKAVNALPLRQQQAFLLRVWEGLDVKTTARAMACSEGSVKTHYSRATERLRQALEGIWP